MIAKNEYQLVKTAEKFANKKTYQQMELFSNIPMSKGVMNRALTEAENYLIAEIRYRIQERLESDSSIDISRPMSFILSIKYIL